MNTATMNTAVEFTDLLEQAGGVPPRRRRGKWRCPECKHTALSVNRDRELYHCFYAGCAFYGSMGTLRKRLGLRREWLPRDEYLRLRREREHANEAARALYERVKARRFELLDGLNTLNRLEVRAHRAGLHPATWGALALVYADRPAVLTELTILENCNVADLVRFLTAPAPTRKAAIDRAIGWGGLYDASGRFVEAGY